jgi:hypothetical protein
MYTKPLIHAPFARCLQLSEAARVSNKGVDSE